MPNPPMLSVGVPVYNAERFLAKALDSILSQTFTDFELLLSDNASTDSTDAICREYAARDGRIRYSRNPTNLGGTSARCTTLPWAGTTSRPPTTTSACRRCLKSASPRWKPIRR